MRISVSELDSFRYWKASDMELADLLRQLRKQEPPSAAMLAGRAFHKLLELSQDEETIDAGQADGHTFLIDVETTITSTPVRELKGEMNLDTPAGAVVLVGIVDGLQGLTVRDYKLTGQFDAEKYIDSYQWRCYLTMFNATWFDYEVFVGKEHDPLSWTITQHHTLTLNSYDGMAADVKREVGEFAMFLAEHLPERK